MKDEVMSPRSSSSSTSCAEVEIESSGGERERRCSNRVEQLIENFKRYKRSTAPSRILFYRNGRWSDFPQEIFEELRSAFVTGRTTVELFMDREGRKNHIIDFLHMVQISDSSLVGRSWQKNSIGWIDENGQCFFPETSAVFEEGEGESWNNRDNKKGREEGIEEARERRVEEGVKMLFVNGMMKNKAAVEVTGVYKCSSSSSGVLKNKKAGFETVMGMTKEARGDTNVRFAWYGVPADTLATMVKHGFWRSTNNGIHGHALHLSPHHLPFQSSMLSEADSDGQKRMVLCRVIMGRCERVEAGSTQYQPSSEEFDSGMDDLLNPKWYLVWSTHINTHILPEYVVSFRTTAVPQPSVSPPARPSLMAARSSFQKLLSEITKSLPSSTMQALENLYLKHKAGKVSRDAFIRHLRSMAGDKLLASTIKRIRGC